MPDSLKWGIFSCFIAFYQQRKLPRLKNKIFPKKALKMPGWQHCHQPLIPFLPPRFPSARRARAHFRLRVNSRPTDPSTQKEAASLRIP